MKNKTINNNFFRIIIISFILLFTNFFAFAETRIKTVEYNFGGYYGADVISGNKTNFPTRKIKLPENGRIDNRKYQCKSNYNLF